MRDFTTAGVIYLLTGPGHGARLVVSLLSLRQYFAGPVTVYTTQLESHEIGRRCAEDPRLRVEHRTCSEVDVPRNSAFLTKVSLLPDVPYDVAIHFDCDTLIRGDIRPLFDAADAGEFAATQFATWHTGKRMIRGRIEQWLGVPPPKSYSADDYETLLQQALEPRPAVNGGVFGFRRGARILSPWHELALAGRDTFICDEIALQILLPRYPHTILDCRFNCSPVYAANCGDVRVWHFHGEKHLSRDSARALWWPAYMECVTGNVAGIRDWTPGGDCRLSGYLRDLTPSVG